MKISKKSATATKDVVTCASKYKDSVNKIYAAIQSLGEFAKDDILAREAIADLSVVMLDLKSTENK